MHGCLCYDGYGFKHGFFDYLRDSAVIRRFERLDGYARNAAYQGLGRAFWFLFMGDHGLLLERLHGLGLYAGDAAAGLGLAAVFVFPDRLATALELGGQLPSDWRADYQLGMCFGLKARAITYADRFERDVRKMGSGVQNAVYASIRECDRLERVVRADGEADPYRRWRERVTRWMTEHIEYPMLAVRSATSEDAQAPSTLASDP
jgi:hypothetical protein